jgi:uncharacterized protein (TIGR03083 family)
MSAAGLNATVTLAREYTDVIVSLQPDEWMLPSRCAGWRVQDLVAHTGSNWQVLVEPPTSDAGESGPPMTAEQAQESLVQARREWTAQQVLDEWLAYQDRALGVLEVLQSDQAADAPLTLSDLGTYASHQLADAFAFDLYCHLRVDLLAPTGPVEREIPTITDELLAPGIGWMLAGLPQMCPAVAPVLDKPLGLVLTGPGGGEWTIGPGSPLLTIADGLDSPAATVTSAATEFVLWGTTRSEWRSACSLDGDQDYAATVLDAVNIV